MTRASGWCLELGGGGHKRCRVPDVCGCGCHGTAKNKAIRDAKHPVLNAPGAVDFGAQVKTAPGTLCVNSESDSQGLARRYRGAPN